MRNCKRGVARCLLFEGEADQQQAQAHENPAYELSLPVKQVLSGAEAFALGQARTEQQRRLLETALVGLKIQFQEDEHRLYARVPLLVYAGVQGDPDPAIPLAVATSLLFLGLDIFDDLADGDLPGHWDGYRPGEINLAAAMLLCALPQMAIAALDAPPVRLAAMQQTLAEGLLRMSAGQQRDLALAGVASVSPAEVETLVAAKSGEEVAMFATLAAQLAGAPPAVAAAYAAYGLALGTAGQLASDCYDLFNAPHSRDLANGTRTLPIARHLARLDGTAREEFLVLLDQARGDAGAQDQVRRGLRAAGALRYDAFIVEIYCQRALAALAQAVPRPPAGAGLASLVDAVSFFPKREVT